ncbi:uncharacterized protein ATNIH1004_000430 [Aspergillus tanneri]|uniref:Uncharacterized protein n=1 Tax=Aspergillus tanneri TaxID=1220188 RepID=A0A5M9N1M7_9EURO|nr:uncharacterized protein ATNIH1004_000430 [Aspergillus tanneri]KAA8651540.1 hypothetical protein ATNIH1004_000430 [Aspergillus tanneri]
MGRSTRLCLPLQVFQYIFRTFLGLRFLDDVLEKEDLDVSLRLFVHHPLICRIFLDGWHYEAPTLFDTPDGEDEQIWTHRSIAKEKKNPRGLHTLENQRLSGLSAVISPVATRQSLSPNHRPRAMHENRHVGLPAGKNACKALAIQNYHWARDGNETA